MDSRSPRLTHRIQVPRKLLHGTAPLVVLPLLALISSCASTAPTVANRAPIQNPFPYDWGYESKPNPRESVVLRTKKGDRSVEVELPGSPGSFSDFTVPVSPAFSDGHPLRSPAHNSTGEPQTHWRDQKPTYSDREITSQFSKGTASAQVRRELEAELGVLPTEDSTPILDSSYLAALDQVKALFRGGRYEAALLEVDELLKLYPTDPKLHQMRGTLLDRTGQGDLAMRSWAEAIELDPSNLSLKKFVERRRSTRLLRTRMPAQVNDVAKEGVAP